MIEWKEAASGVWELWIYEIESEKEIAVLYDEKLYSPSTWKQKMKCSLKSYNYDYGNNYHTALNAEDIESAKKELEEIIVKSCKEGLISIKESYERIVKRNNLLIQYLEKHN